MDVFFQDSSLNQTACWLWKTMAANFPPLDCLQILKSRNKNMKKETIPIVFENWFKNTPIQKWRRQWKHQRGSTTSFG
jgi:hypothetical protein